MNKDKIIKDLKKRNDSLKMQYEYRNIRCIHLENENQRLEQENQQLQNNRDKAIEYMKNNSKISLDDSVSIIRFYKQLKSILEGDSDE